MEVCCFCKKLAKSRCTRCLTSFYCSQDCQKKDWKDHKTHCVAPFWSLSSSEEKGRIVVAKKDIAGGETIFYEAPLLLAKKSDFTEEIEKIVEKTCEIKSDEYGFSDDGIVAILQFLKEDQPAKDRLLAFYCPQISNESKNYLTDCLDILKSITNTSESIDTLMKVYLITLCNAFGNTNNNIVALYPIGCAISHSCISNSNCVVMDENEKCLLCVRSLIDIKKDEEITHCYNYKYMFLPTKYRKVYFLKTRFFECKCDICKNPPIVRYYKCNCTKGNIAVRENNECEECDVCRKNDFSVEKLIKREEVVSNIVRNYDNNFSLLTNEKINELMDLYVECIALYSPKHYIFLTFYSIFHDLFRMGISEENRKRFMLCYLCCMFRIDIIKNISEVPNHLLANLYLDMADDGFCFLGGQFSDVLEEDYLNAMSQVKAIKIPPFFKEHRSVIESLEKGVKWETVQGHYGRAKELFIKLLGKDHEVVKNIEKKMCITSLKVQIHVVRNFNQRLFE